VWYGTEIVVFVFSNLFIYGNFYCIHNFYENKILIDLIIS